VNDQYHPNKIVIKYFFPEQKPSYRIIETISSNKAALNQNLKKLKPTTSTTFAHPPSSISTPSSLPPCLSKKLSAFEIVTSLIAGGRLPPPLPPLPFEFSLRAIPNVENETIDRRGQRGLLGPREKLLESPDASDRTRVVDGEVKLGSKIFLGMRWGSVLRVLEIGIEGRKQQQWGE